MIDRTLLRSDDALVAAVQGAVSGGVDAVHLRDPAATAAELLRLGERLRPALVGQAALVVNDRLDVALALAADAVQLGGRSLPVAVARRIAPGLRIGASVHSPDEAGAAADAGADWLLLGSIYPTRSHPGLAGGGRDLIAASRLGVRRPIIAIGGIDASRVEDVVGSGADGVAVISAILASADPHRAAADLRARLDAALSRRSGP